MKWKIIFVITIILGIVVGASLVYRGIPRYTSTLEILPLLLKPFFMKSVVGNNTFEHNGLTFKIDNFGMVKISKEGEFMGLLGFAIQGKVNGIKYTYTNNNFTWSWKKDNYTEIELGWDEEKNQTINISKRVDVFTVYNNKPNFNWTQKWIFHEDRDVKIQHSITNNLGKDIKNTSFWYVIQVPDYQFTQVDTVREKADFKDLEFRFRDLINNSFVIDDYYIGDGGRIGFEGKKLIGVSFTKGNGTLIDGKTITLDPEVTDFKSPDDTGYPSDEWTDGANVKTANDQRAIEGTIGDMLDTSNYSFFDDESMKTVHGIQVRVQGRAGGSCVEGMYADVGVSLSGDGGATYSNELVQRFTSCPKDTNKFYGNLTHDWGQLWAVGNFSDTNFRARLNHTGEGSSGASQVDIISVRINFTDVFGDPPMINLSYPLNETNITTRSTFINWSLNDSEANAMEVWVYGSDNLSHLDENLLFHNRTLGNGNYTYFWTAPLMSTSGGLWAVYHLDNLSWFGESDSKIVDFVNGRNLTSKVGDPEPLETTGKFGGEWVFDGDDGIRAPLGSGETNMCDNGCSFSVWLRSNDTLTAGVALGRYTTVNDDRFIRISVNLVEAITFEIWPDGTSGGCSATTSDATFQTDNSWQHIVGVYNNQTNQTKIFYNGNLKTTTDCSFSSINTTAWDDNEQFRIGGDASSLSQDWNGSIDELVVWNRSLTDSEASNLYQLVNEQTYYWEVNATDGNSDNVSAVWRFTPSILCSIDCSTNPTLNTNVDCGQDNLTFFDSGTVEVQANYTNWDEIHKYDLCEVRGWQRLFT
jgi:hypothetical protein